MVCRSTHAAQATLLFFLASIIGVSSCGPRLDEVRVTADVKASWPGVVISYVGAGDGSSGYQEWFVEGADSAGRRVRVDLSYGLRDSVGWRILSIVRSPK